MVQTKEYMAGYKDGLNGHAQASTHPQYTRGYEVGLRDQFVVHIKKGAAN